MYAYFEVLFHTHAKFMQFPLWAPISRIRKSSFCIPPLLQCWVRDKLCESDVVTGWQKKTKKQKTNTEPSFHWGSRSLLLSSLVLKIKGRERLSPSALPSPVLLPWQGPGLCSPAQTWAHRVGGTLSVATAVHLHVAARLSSVPHFWLCLSLWKHSLCSCHRLKHRANLVLWLSGPSSVWCCGRVYGCLFLLLLFSFRIWS